MSNKAIQPFMSVVICSYNGAAVVGRAIESLLAQDYPKDRYEIIVVNDGSSDATAQVIQRFPVKYIEHPENSGISAARNTGLAAARGDIYVGFDDDCVAPRDWLNALSTGYVMTNAAGVGGRVAEPENISGIVDHFMAATGSGNPPSLALNPDQSPLKRLLAYITNQIIITSAQPVAIYRARELNGAVASFPVSILKGVGGWDLDMTGIEDTDISRRIMLAYPDHSFYVVTSTALVHDPKMSFWHFLRRPYYRGAATLQYYRRHDLIPAVFPLPIVWLTGALIASPTSPMVALLAALLLPQLLYAWWPLRAIREKHLLCLLFPYVQMSEEIVITAGLIRGYAITWRKRHE